MVTDPSSIRPERGEVPEALYRHREHVGEFRLRIQMSHICGDARQRERIPNMNIRSDHLVMYTHFKASALLDLQGHACQYGPSVCLSGSAVAAQTIFTPDAGPLFIASRQPYSRVTEW